MKAEEHARRLDKNNNNNNNKSVLRIFQVRISLNP